MLLPARDGENFVKLKSKKSLRKGKKKKGKKKKGKKKKGKGKVEGGKKGEGKGKEKQISEGDDWECRRCNTSFSQDEENGNECKWIQCDKCKEASHIDCIPDLHRMLFTVDTNKEDEYLCPTCWYMESEVDD